jgi:hypothetical protein
METRSSEAQWRPYRPLASARKECAPSVPPDGSSHPKPPRVAKYGSGRRRTETLDAALLGWLRKSFLGTWGRSLYIDRRRSKAGPDDNELALLVAVVAFAMNSTLRDMDKISSYGRDDLRTTRSRFQS